QRVGGRGREEVSRLGQLGQCRPGGQEHGRRTGRTGTKRAGTAFADLGAVAFMWEDFRSVQAWWPARSRGGDPERAVRAAAAARWRKWVWERSHRRRPRA